MKRSRHRFSVAKASWRFDSRRVIFEDSRRLIFE
jgi:hypothetical protein